MSTALAPQRDAQQLAGLPATALPAPIDKKALTSYLAALEDPAALELQQRLAKAYDAACKALIGENDVQKEGNREFKKKSAWRKLQRYFNISTSVIAIEKEFIGEEFMATVTVRATAPWGQTSEAAGSCATDEEEGRRKITMADAVGTAETRATNRVVSNLIAMGEVSAEEIGERKGADRQRPEMDLDEANSLTWPWNEPEKYKGKALAEVSTLSLLRVQEWAQKKVEAGRAGKQIERMLEAATIIISNRDDADAAQQQWEAEQSKKAGKATEEKATPSIDSLVQRATELLKDPRVPAELRERINARWFEREITVALLEEAIAELEPYTASEGGEARSQSQAAPASATPPSSAPTAATSEPTVPELNVAAHSAAIQELALEQQRTTSDKATLQSLTERVFKMLTDGAFAADVRARVRKELAAAPALTQDVLEAAIATIEAARLPF